jgi:predicted Zn-dependent protease
LIYAHFLLLKNQPQDAFKTLKTIENTADNMPEYLELMAFTQAALGHHEEATQDYRFLLSQDPHNQRLLLNLAISLQKSQQNERALVIYQQLESEKNLSPEFKAYISEQLDKLEH